MVLEFAKAIAVVEVFALREVRYSPLLGQDGPEAEFKRLLMSAATRIVEEQLNGGSPLGGRYLDGEDDDDGDGTRLHFWLEQSGSTYRMVIIQFDYASRQPPIVTDTMALLHGERFPICKFVVYRNPDNAVQIEFIPSGTLSDEKQAAKAPRRPAATPKPLVHRLVEGLLSLCSAATERLGAQRRASLAQNRCGTRPAPPDAEAHAACSRRRLHPAPRSLERARRRVDGEIPARWADRHAQVSCRQATLDSRPHSRRRA